MELVQQLKQQQILAPQMILSMDILLLTSQELEARIEKEFMENPALEIVEEHARAASPADAAAERPAGEAERSFEHLETFVPPPDDSWTPQRRRRTSSEGFDKQEALQNMEGRPPGLREFLLQQVRLLDLSPRVMEVCEYIINDIDDRGYLLHAADELRQSLEDEVTDEEFDIALRTVRSLDPAGVGAENLQECLALQLGRDEGQDYSFELELLREHAEDLRQNKIPKIAREMGSTVDEIKDALELIAMLEPYPGREFSSGAHRYIRPDVIVEEHDGEFRITVHDEDLPPLKISDTCKELLQKHRREREVSSFLKRKIDSAQWLIHAVRQRHNTIKDIAECLVRYQIDFMRHGPEHLKAMKMQTIADLVGVHISTISRATKGKYIQTPHGIFELKYFFTGGVERADGEVESRRNVYRQIKALIDSEDKRRPLSDTAIARKLREQGLDIARRTVTKYRDREGIPPSRLRRQY